MESSKCFHGRTVDTKIPRASAGGAQNSMCK